MNQSPLISVIIPTYNCEKYLPEAIESVLAQTYKPFEIIVIDDGSTDNTADRVKHFGSSIQYHIQANAGSAAARNFGIELARGDFFAFLDADDLWVEDKLNRQMAAFGSDPELDIVFGLVQQFHSPDLDEEMKAKVYCPSELVPGHIPSALLVKREAFFRVGLFETKWKIAEFASWYVRIAEVGLKTQTLPHLVAKRRLHKTNKGVKDRQFQAEYVQILKASLDRRRTQNSKML